MGCRRMVAAEWVSSRCGGTCRGGPCWEPNCCGGPCCRVAGRTGWPEHRPHHLCRHRRRKLPGPRRRHRTLVLGEVAASAHSCGSTRGRCSVTSAAGEPVDHVAADVADEHDHRGRVLRSTRIVQHEPGVVYGQRQTGVGRGAVRSPERPAHQTGRSGHHVRCRTATGRSWCAARSRPGRAGASDPVPGTSWTNSSSRRPAAGHNGSGTAHRRGSSGQPAIRSGDGPPSRSGRASSRMTDEPSTRTWICSATTRGPESGRSATGRVQHQQRDERPEDEPDEISAMRSSWCSAASAVRR